MKLIIYMLSKSSKNKFDDACVSVVGYFIEIYYANWMKLYIPSSLLKSQVSLKCLYNGFMNL